MPDFCPQCGEVEQYHEWEPTRQNDISIPHAEGKECGYKDP